jgi:bacteriocin-like protein
MSKSDNTSNLDHDARAESALGAVTGRNIEMADDELKQVTGGALKLPGLHKASDVTLKRGVI